MLRLRSVADGLLGVFVPKLTAAAGPPCEDLVRTFCSSDRCSSTSSPWFVQNYRTICNTCWGCSGLSRHGCCAI